MAHILVVDDELLAGMALQSYLIRRGHKVTLAHNGPQGIDRALADPPDIVVTDWRMPKMNGGDMVTYLRGLRPTLPVVFVTGFAPEMEAFAKAERAPTAVLDKPVDPTAVTALVAQLLSA